MRIFLQKCTKYFATFGSIFKNVTFYVKIALTTFGAFSGKIGLLSIPVSGHTDCIENIL